MRIKQREKMELVLELSKVKPDFSESVSSITHVPSGVGIRDRAGDT